MPNIQTKLRRFVASNAWTIAFSVALTACGGGTDSSLTGTPTPSPAPSPAPSPTPAPVVSADTSCGIPNFQADLLASLNAVRNSGAVCGGVAFAATSSVGWDGQLKNAASAHSTDMASNNFFAHTSASNGTTLRERVPAAGYNYRVAGENIAAGQTSVAQVMADWVNSPSHCANLMNPVFRDVGISCVINTAATYQYYWTMALGVRQ